MTTRTTIKTVTFHRPFYLKGVDRLLPPANYRVVTDEELIEGLSFPAYRRTSTVIFVPAESGCAVEMVTIDPSDLQAAIDRDARERIDCGAAHHKRSINQLPGFFLMLTQEECNKITASITLVSWHFLRSWTGLRRG